MRATNPLRGVIAMKMKVITLFTVVVAVASLASWMTKQGRAEFSQNADGVIVLTPDSKQPDASFDFQPTRWGSYDVSISLDTTDGTEVELRMRQHRVEKVDGKNVEQSSMYALKGRVKAETFLAGRVKFVSAEKVSLEVVDGTGINLLKSVRHILLKPAPEGESIVQQGDRTVVLESANCTVHGVSLRYEPQPHKNTIGYWSNASDWASWDFDLKIPGRFRVVLRQGCGSGHGGSKAKISVGTSAIEFMVIETGGFQTWLDRDLGTIVIDTPGRYSLDLRALSKVSGAVMDCQSIKLEPVP